jgi:hypothetical protein
MKRIAGAWETKWKKYLTWEIVSTTDANYYERPSSIISTFLIFMK